MSQENLSTKQPLIRIVNRQQMSWRAVGVEKLIGKDHPARAIWELVGRLESSAFCQALESSAEQGGRPASDPPEQSPKRTRRVVRPLGLNLRVPDPSRFSRVGGAVYPQWTGSIRINACLDFE
jgi:hypothetical protein